MACLNYIDFLSISAQRAALVMAANCCQNMSKEDFSYVRDSLSLLSARLNHEVCWCICMKLLLQVSKKHVDCG